jgi:hypothetical protein
MPTYISPIDERTRPPVPFARRLPGLAGQRIALLDISKPKGAEFLDRIEQRLREEHGVAEVVRLRKPTFTRPAPADILSEAERCGAVLVALAD